MKLLISFYLRNFIKEILQSPMSDEPSHQISPPQNHAAQDDNSGNVRRKRTLMAQAKKEGKQVLHCTQCKKEYLSYPALYTHCKLKHPNHKVSSKNTTKENKNPPIQKMKTLLKESIQAKNQQIERKLLMIIHKSALEIIKKFEDVEPGLGKQLGKYNKSFQKMEDVKKKGLEFAQTIHLDKNLFQKEEIFKEVAGKIMGISFGGDILQTFINSKIASKLYLQLSIIQNFSSYQEKLELIEKKIWKNMSVDWKFLFQNWQHYEQTLKLFRKQQQTN